MKSINLPAKKIFAILLGSIFLSADLEAGENDYIYPNQEPSFSNYGTLGLFSSPSARFLDEGSLGFAWKNSCSEPVVHGNVSARTRTAHARAHCERTGVNGCIIVIIELAALTWSIAVHYATEGPRPRIMYYVLCNART